MPTTMTMVADTHIHVYPRYALAAALDGLAANLDRLAGAETGAAGDPLRVACLAERADCHFFAECLRTGSRNVGEGIEIGPAESGDALQARSRGRGEVTILPGRQIVTRERLEILALTRDLDLADDRPAREVVEAILAADAIPVVSWALGKWTLRRREVVESLLAAFAPGSLVLGDTSMRPRPGVEPALMRQARRMGYAVLAGSDPLPFRGEEKRLGVYGSRIVAGAAAVSPAVALRAALQTRETQAQAIGRRCHIGQVAVRWWRSRLGI